MWRGKANREDGRSDDHVVRVCRDINLLCSLLVFACVSSSRCVQSRCQLDLPNKASLNQTCTHIMPFAKY